MLAGGPGRPNLRMRSTIAIDRVPLRKYRGHRVRVFLQGRLLKLRAATTLSRLLRDQCRAADAMTLLSAGLRPVYGRARYRQSRSAQSAPRPSSWSGHSINFKFNGTERRVRPKELLCGGLAWDAASPGYAGHTARRSRSAGSRRIRSPHSGAGFACRRARSARAAAVSRQSLRGAGAASDCGVAFAGMGCTVGAGRVTGIAQVGDAGQASLYSLPPRSLSTFRPLLSPGVWISAA
jgi:hypothetical protein